MGRYLVSGCFNDFWSHMLHNAPNRFFWGEKGKARVEHESMHKWEQQINLLLFLGETQARSLTSARLMFYACLWLSVTTQLLFAGKPHLRSFHAAAKGKKKLRKAQMCGKHSSGVCATCLCFVYRAAQSLHSAFVIKLFFHSSEIAT